MLHFYLFDLTGNFSGSPSLKAVQYSLTGHNKHFGEVGVQISAPSSIKPWLNDEA